MVKLSEDNLGIKKPISSIFMEYLSQNQKADMFAKNGIYWKNNYFYYPMGQLFRIIAVLTKKEISDISGMLGTFCR